VKTLRRALKGYGAHGLGDWAAALTYYGVLAVFPALLVLVSLLGLIGESATQPLLDELQNVAPGPAQEILTSAIENLQRSGGASGAFFVIGLLGAVWSASGYVAGFMRASNAVNEVEEDRAMWQSLPTRVGVTVLLMVLTGVCAFAVAVSGGVAQELGDLVGVGDTAVTVWGIAKWPVLLFLISLLFAVLYWATPNVKQRFRWLSPGGLLAVTGWALASAGFAVYVSNFGSYNKTYGALAGPIVFLIWLWITNIMILLGAELNAELERPGERRLGASTEGEADRV
jgi:membrane protein